MRLVGRLCRASEPSWQSSVSSWASSSFIVNTATFSWDLFIKISHNKHVEVLKGHTTDSCDCVSLPIALMFRGWHHCCLACTVVIWNKSQLYQGQESRTVRYDVCFDVCSVCLYMLPSVWGFRIVEKPQGSLYLLNWRLWYLLRIPSV